MSRFLFSLFLLSTLVLLGSCSREKTLFSKLSPAATNIDFKNDLPDQPNLNILYYLYYYNGGGVAIGDVNNDGLPDIYFTANRPGKNKLYLNKGNLKFEDVTEAAGVAGIADWCSGVTMADVNGDGWLDIYVSTVSNVFNLQGHNLLYINNGNKEKPSFTESAKKYGLNFRGMTTQAAFFDYDRDGDLDCFLLNHSQQPHANIVDTVFRRKKHPMSGDVLFRNDGNVFTDVSEGAGIYQSSLGYGLGLAIADFNNDGWDDIYVGNDFHENDYYYLNNGNGSFTESGSSHFAHYSRFSMGNDAADFDNDGNIDIITVDMLPDNEKILKTYGSDENPDTYRVKLMMNGYQHQYSKNALQRNNGNGLTYSDWSLLAGVAATDWSWSPLFADFDNDGNKDLFISAGIVKRPVDMDYVRFVSDMQLRKGSDKTNKYDKELLDKMPDGASHPFLFKGNGQGGFENVSATWGTAGLSGYHTGSAYGDLDNDGDLDVVINSINSEATVLENKSGGAAFINISFSGAGANRFGIGCKVFAFSQGRFQYQQLMATRGFQSASDQRLHFGGKNFDSLVVVWPDGRFQRLDKPGTGFITVAYKDASGAFDMQRYIDADRLFLAEGKTLPWKHQEDNFDDYNVQYLIPHAQSTRGPKVAVADVNKDGLDDIYLCGARNQPGTLLIQQHNGEFSPSNKSLFDMYGAAEEVDATFFDANGDGAPDLYVAHGGNVFPNGHPLLHDKLYINDGRGNFRLDTAALPAMLTNKSCIAVADIDQDGDIDIFAGSLADAQSYGTPQTSYLLINNGQGKFSFAPPSLMALQNLGIVTSAAFGDMNGDGRPELIVAGEWMPITMFINQKTGFAKKELPSGTGWWQNITVVDANSDGHLDILAGNWGWNSKFKSGKDGPVRLYVSDFDKNGRTDQLLSYTANGKEYPFLAKDEAERSLPVLRKHYLHYGDFAGLEMKDAYYGFVETVEPLVASRMSSVVCFNDGKGNFGITELPQELQAAPIFAFQKVASFNNANIFCAGGNFFETIPYEGRYDAQPMAFFAVDKNGKLYKVNHPPLLHGRQVRDLKWIAGGKDSALIVAVNNENPVLFNKPNVP